MPILPMTDDRVATEVRTVDGSLKFEDDFVARRHAETLSRFDSLGSIAPTRRGM